MPGPPRRKFNVLDAMALVAASAAGFALLRYDHENLSGLFAEYGAIFGSPETLKSSWVVFDAISYTIRRIQPLFFAWTLAILLLRLRRPRPIFRRLARQPGFAACFSVVLVSLIIFLGAMSSCAHFPVRGPFRRWDIIEWYYAIVFYGSLNACGSSVAATWAVMALGRSLRPEASWLDRTGRLLGICWLGLLVQSVAESQAD